jgi:phenylacetate-CoA ligase
MMPDRVRFAALRVLLPYSWESRERITRFQTRQLRSLVSHAYGNVPYYRKLFDRHGLQPGDIRTLADLEKIPITSKQDLLGLPPSEVVAKGVDPDRLIVRKTSGSTGEPSIIRRTWLEERTLGVNRLRAMQYFGLRPTDKVCRIILPKPLHPRDNQTPLRILEKMGLYRSVAIDCLAPPDEIVGQLCRHRPDLVFGLAGMVFRVAQWILDEDLQVIRPRFVAVGSDVLTPPMRQVISDALAARVFESYGSHEFHLIAWECKETGELHICDDIVIIEVLRDGKPARPGERGEVIATGLHSFAMPFIRYRLGDIVTQGSETCRCGLSFSTIRNVEGRMLDFFPLPGARVIHPYEILPLVRRTPDPWYRQYQMIQEREDRILFKAVAPVPPSRQELDSIEQTVKARLGQGVEFKIVLVPEIRPDAAGKFRVSRSFVESAYDGHEAGAGECE